MKRKCNICGVNPREVPDREVMGRPTKKICRRCHLALLRGDIEEVLRVERSRRVTR